MIWLNKDSDVGCWKKRIKELCKQFDLDLNKGFGLKRHHVEYLLRYERGEEHRNLHSIINDTITIVERSKIPNSSTVFYDNGKINFDIYENSDKLTEDEQIFGCILTLEAQGAFGKKKYVV